MSATLKFMTCECEYEQGGRTYIDIIWCLYKQNGFKFLFNQRNVNIFITNWWF